jgi:hypothetical protein
LASYLDDCRSVIFHQSSNYLRCHRTQPAPTAPAWQFPLAISVLLACRGHDSLGTSVSLLPGVLPGRARIRLSKDALYESCAPQYPFITQLPSPTLSLGSHFKPSPSCSGQPPSDQLRSPPQRHSRCNKPPVRLFRPGILRSKLRQNAVAVLPGVGLRS